MSNAKDHLPVSEWFHIRGDSTGTVVWSKQGRDPKALPNTVVLGTFGVDARNKLMSDATRFTRLIMRKRPDGKITVIAETNFSDNGALSKSTVEATVYDTLEEAYLVEFVLPGAYVE